MSSYCEQEGYPYACDEPTPRSAFNDSAPLCESVAQYLYDPANCDAGHWCGCSSTNSSQCIPTNDTSATLWGGFFTTYDTSTNETIILMGQFQDDESGAICPLHYYCPGRNNTEICVDLCSPEYYCPNPAESVRCHDGYCPVGSAQPKDCEGLETCNSDGLRRFELGPAVVVLFLVCIISIIYLYASKYFLIKSAHNRKNAKLEAKGDEEADGDEVVDDSGDNGAEKPEEAAVDAENGSKKGSRLFGSRNTQGTDGTKKHRRSTITAPDMTIDILCEGLRLEIPGVGTIMRGVSATLDHGNLTAVMGPSGAGKTTFLSLMSGKVDRTGGTLKINGEEEELSSFRKSIGFVPQEDVMLRELSVEENVTHSALMRLPIDWSHEKKMARVDEILESLEIDHIRDSVVGDEKRRGISGGQRKRVNIAMEMVVKPSLLCLDEPTSGLDSTTSYTVVNSLKDMARAGANVITVLHQPKYEVFELFDNVLLLGKGGMTVYYGPTLGMQEYFSKRGFTCPEHSNPADFYMDVLSGIIPHPDNPDFDKEDLFEEWMCAEENPDAISKEEARERMEKIKAEDDETKEKTAKQDASERRWFIGKFCCGLMREFHMVYRHLFSNLRPDKTGRKTPNAWTQFILLYKRASLQRVRLPSTTVLNIVLMFIAGAIVPGIVPSDTNLYVGIPKTLNETNSGYEAYLRQNVDPKDQIPGTLMSVYMFLLIVSCLSVNVFGPERVVFFRETAVGQSVLSYWAGKTFETLLWLPIYTSAFTLLGYVGEAWLIQPLRSYWLFMFCTLVGFYGIGMLASLLVGPGSAALLALVFGLIILVGFSGTITAYGDQSSGMQTFTNFWFLFWATQGLCSKEYHQYTYAFNITRLNDETPDKYDNSFGVGEQAVGAGVGMGFDLDSSYGRNLGFCALTAYAWILIVLWTLKTKDHRKHR